VHPQLMGMDLTLLLEGACCIYQGNVIDLGLAVPTLATKLIWLVTGTHHWCL
jgi:hypothetical protein